MIPSLSGFPSSGSKMLSALGATTRPSHHCNMVLPQDDDDAWHYFWQSYAVLQIEEVVCSEDRSIGGLMQQQRRFSTNSPQTAFARWNNQLGVPFCGVAVSGSCKLPGPSEYFC